MDKTSIGYLYILTNPSFPDWIKIGRCTHLEKRINSLSSNTCLPFPFECFYACRISSPNKVEATLHYIFNQFRLSPKREFFNVDPEKVIAALSLIPYVQEISPPKNNRRSEDKVLLEKEIERQSHFKFSHASISLGDEIYFTRFPKIKAYVVSDTHIQLDNQVMSLIAATKKCLKENIGEAKTKISSPRYWSYSGEMLVVRKHRLS